MFLLTSKKVPVQNQSPRWDFFTGGINCMFYFFQIGKFFWGGAGGENILRASKAPSAPPYSEGTENGQMAHKVSTGEQKTGKEKRAAQIVCTYIL